MSGTEQQDYPIIVEGLRNSFGEFVIHGVGSPLGGIRVKDDRIHLRWIL